MSEGEGGSVDCSSESADKLNAPVTSSLLQLRKGGLFGKSAVVTKDADGTVPTVVIENVKSDNGAGDHGEIDTSGTNFVQESLTEICDNDEANEDLEECETTDDMVKVDVAIEETEDVEQIHTEETLVSNQETAIGGSEADIIGEPLDESTEREIDGDEECPPKITRSRRSAGNSTIASSAKQRKSVRSSESSTVRTPARRSTKADISSDLSEDKNDPAVLDPKQTPLNRQHNRRSTKIEVVSERRGRKKIDNVQVDGSESDNSASVRTPQTNSRSLRTRTKIADQSDTDKATPRRTKADITVVENSTSGTNSVRKRGRPSATGVSSSSTPKKTPKKDADSDHDPFDFETEMEIHPEPFKNIQMEMQSFGDVKYGKLGSGTYDVTERTAEARISNLSDFVPTPTNRRSLADLTPGRNKNTGSSTPKTATSKRGRARKSSTADNGSNIGDDDDDLSKQEFTPKLSSAGRKRKASPSASSSKRLSTADYVPPEVNADEQWRIDYPEDEHAAHEAGARVFALYGKMYYPAIIAQTGKDNLGRYKVFFLEDQLVKDVPAAGVIPLRALVADKKCVATTGSRDPDDVQVIASPNAASATEWLKAAFVVRPLDNTDSFSGPELRVEWVHLSLDMHEWKDYINKKSLEVTNVVADNISTNEARNSRRSKLSNSATTVASDVSVTRTPVTPISKSRSKPSTNKKVTKRPSPVAPQEAEVEIPQENNDQDVTSPLFADMMFILTSAQRQTVEGASTFKKKMMSDFIEQCQGLVVEDFNEVDNHPELQAFLITDTHYRTHKYLSAMSRGVPCVSHEWILACRDSRSLVDYKDHLLPAGISILDQKQYPLPKNQNTLLEGKVVLVHTNNRPSSAKALNFIQIWEPMVNRLGGHAVTEMPDKPNIIDIMLTDASASSDLLEIANNDGAKIVSSEWLIQGIIMGKLPDVDAHPRFSFDGGAAR